MSGRKTEKNRPAGDGELWYMDPERARKAVLAETAAPLPEENILPLSGEKAGGANAGHRGRLRERFREQQGFDGFSDHEILELLLTYGSPRRDTKASAKRLEEVFGGLKGVFEARPEQLMRVEGIGEAQATLSPGRSRTAGTWRATAAACCWASGWRNSGSSASTPSAAFWGSS